MKRMSANRKVAASAHLIDVYGFAYADIASVRTCFDILAERHGRMLILKFAENINSVTPREATALHKLQDFLKADALVVASHGGEGKLSDDSYYTRNGIKCLSIDAFEDYLNGVGVPKAQKFFRGKRRLDSSKLRLERGLSGLSIRKLAGIVGISKDSLSRYEQGDAYVRESTLKKLEAFFSSSLSAGESTANHEMPSSAHAERSGPGTKGFTLRAFNSFIDNAPPFALLAEKSIRYEIGITDDSRTIKRLAAAYGEISRILSGDRQFIISDLMKSKSLNGVPILTKKESKMLNELQLLELVDSRRD
ncbi:MAG: helix-turn-helix domain-containing protein [Candidatus Micrarchaeaceae archaeon]